MIRRFVNAIVDAQERWADPFGEGVQKVLRAIWGPIRPLKDFLHGTWWGHPLHPLFTDVPVGAFTAAVLLDVLDVRQGADIAIAVGLLAMLAAWVTGLADYTDTDLSPPRSYATVHGLLMTASLVLYAISLGQRLGQPPLADRTAAVGLALAGYTVLFVGAYLGGELVFKMGNMVDRHAWRSGGTKWSALDLTEIPEGQPTRARAGAQSLVVVRRGERIFALHDVCAHAGCNLSEGKLVGDAIECGCHGSRFDLATGHVVGGPATFDQPRYEVRSSEGMVEVRRAEP